MCVRVMCVHVCVSVCMYMCGVCVCVLCVCMCVCVCVCVVCVSYLPTYLQSEDAILCVLLTPPTTMPRDDFRIVLDRLSLHWQTCRAEDRSHTRPATRGNLGLR